MEVAEKVHTFNVSLKWDYETNSGLARSESRMPLLFGPPPEFGGAEMNWSPEHLITASLAGCYMNTFIHFAKLLKVTITNIRVTAKAEFEKKQHGFEATRYIIRPVVEFHNTPGQYVIDNLFQKAKKYCIISNSVKGEVCVEPNVITG